MWFDLDLVMVKPATDSARLLILLCLCIGACGVCGDTNILLLVQNLPVRGDSGRWFVVVVRSRCLQEALRECRCSIFECWEWVLLLALWDYISVPRVMILHEVQCWCMVCSYSSYPSLVCVCTCLVTQPVIKPVLAARCRQVVNFLCLTAVLLLPFPFPFMALPLPLKIVFLCFLTFAVVNRYFELVIFGCQVAFMILSSKISLNMQAKQC